jgi:tetratricopeptide (TPR) repeat protein
MKEVNEAYNSVMRIREGGGSYRPGTGRTSSSGGSADGMRVRSAINSGNVELAEELLREFPVRNAEWHFLMGSVCYRRGWLDDAQGYFQKAVSMEPGNYEYRQAMSYMNQGGQAYRSYGRGPMANQGCDACDCCTAMLCMNLCCRC